MLGGGLSTYSRSEHTVATLDRAGVSSCVELTGLRRCRAVVDSCASRSSPSNRRNVNATAGARADRAAARHSHNGRSGGRVCGNDCRQRAGGGRMVLFLLF